MTPDLLAGLNPAQHEAVTAPARPVLVLAGPGSGKTRVLTHRIAYLITQQRAHPRSIIAVTFTNKAAGEMRDRVERLVGRRLDQQVGTFHALCARLLRIEAEHTAFTRNYVIYDTDDQIAALKQAIGEEGVNLKDHDSNAYKVLNAISAAKNELIPPPLVEAHDLWQEIVKRVYARYQQLLAAADARDFDDLIMDAVALLRDVPAAADKYARAFEHVLVDEFQDTNTAQYELVRLWARPQNSVFVVGDEDQGIYGFRGADYRNVARFRRDYPDAHVVLLEQNYRSGQNILDAARAVIDRNPNRTPKHLFTDRGPGPRLRAYEAYDEDEEARFIVSELERLRAEGQLPHWREAAVMYRTNAQSRALEQAFITARLPYHIVGGVGFYQRREVRDLLAYLRLVNNPNDVASLARVINTPTRGIGDKTIERLRAHVNATGTTYHATLDGLADGSMAVAGVSGRSASSLAAFARMLADWRATAAHGDLVLLLDTLMQDVGYDDHLRATSKTTDETEDRRENVQALRALLDAHSAVPLGDYLAEIALVADIERPDAADSVALLTLHAAKGLEFRVVFLAGLEDGILPHSRSLDESDGFSALGARESTALQEERRLMYVGLTRAADRLYLSRAIRRMTGPNPISDPSRFLRDIPLDLFEPRDAHMLDASRSDSYTRMTTWDWDAPAATPYKPASAPRTSFRPAGPPLRYQPGQRVFHARFGEGMVVESRRQADDEEVAIAFERPGVGIKRLMASFANLTHL